MEEKMNNNNYLNKETEQEIGRAEKIHIYISGIIWLTIILLVGGFIVYVLVGVAMMDWLNIIKKIQINPQSKMQLRIENYDLQIGDAERKLLK